MYILYDNNLNKYMCVCVCVCVCVGGGFVCVCARARTTCIISADYGIENAYLGTRKTIE